MNALVLGLADADRSVLLDVGEDAVDRLVRRATVACQSTIGHDEVHFTIEPKVGQFARRRAVKARVPELVVKVQRRDYHRVRLRAGDDVACDVLLPQPSGPPRATPVTVLDVSGTGLAFQLPLGLGAQLRLHTDLDGCRLALPGDVEVRAALRVRSLRKLIDADGTRVRVGAQFVGMVHRDTALVQRALTALERAHREAG